MMSVLARLCDSHTGPTQYFIEALLATTEFETFFSMMLGEAADQRKKASGK